MGDARKPPIEKNSKDDAIVSIPINLEYLTDLT